MSVFDGFCAVDLGISGDFYADEGAGEEEEAYEEAADTRGAYMRHVT